jgi:hypothetical protein
MNSSLLSDKAYKTLEKHLDDNLLDVDIINVKRSVTEREKFQFMTGSVQGSPHIILIKCMWVNR